MIIVLSVGFRVVRVGMMTVEEFDGMKTAFVDIKVNVSGFKVGRAGFPHERFRVCFFDRFPRGIPDPFAVTGRGNEQQIQTVVTSLFIDRQYKPAYDGSVFPDPIGNAVVDTFFDCFP